MDDTPDARLARWADRDHMIGLVAEVEQLRARLAERDGDAANLRERCQELSRRVGELEVERNRLSALATAAPRATFGRRVYRRLRRLAGRVLRR